MVPVFAIVMLAGVAVPAVLLARARPGGLGEWLLLSGAAFATVAFVLVSGPWVFLSVHARALALLAVTVSAAVSFRLMMQEAIRPGASRRARLRIIASAIALLAFGGLAATGLMGHRMPARAAELRMPFRTGTFAVLQGGDSLLLNPFHRVGASERFALDLVRVNEFGNRARGLAPRSVDGYESFGVAVESPCEGIVEHATDGLPDNRPGEADRGQPAGNHVVLNCAGIRVLLAHLRQGSVRLRSGERVRTGEPIGEIGNSGNTLEPHLHMSAAAAEGAMRLPAEAIPLTFGGRFLALNDIVRLGSP